MQSEKDNIYLDTKPNRAKNFENGAIRFSQIINTVPTSGRLPPNRYVLGIFRKLSTKNTTRLENSSNRYIFFENISVTI